MSSETLKEILKRIGLVFLVALAMEGLIVAFVPPQKNAVKTFEYDKNGSYFVSVWVDTSRGKVECILYKGRYVEEGTSMSCNWNLLVR